MEMIFQRKIIEKNRNIYYQSESANEIISQVNQIISLLTFSLNIHLNIGQSSIINTSEVFMSLETISIDSLLNKQIKQVGNAQIHIPSNFNLNTTNNSTMSLRVTFSFSFFF